MASVATDPSIKEEDNQDLYLGQPIDRRGKTLTDEQAAIFSRYNHWKQNLMSLYNHIETYALPYPARTVQFLPNPKEIVSPQNQYKRYTNCPFIYPSHCTVPKQERSVSSSDGMHSNERTSKMTPIYYLQSMNYFVPNRTKEQQDLYRIKTKAHHMDFSTIAGIHESALITGILPYDEYYHGGPCVESAYDVYKLRVMPQAPHLLATRSYHEDIAIYWMNYNHLRSPLNAFEKHKQNVIPERSGLSLSDDEEDEDNDIQMKTRKRKRNGDEQYPNKKHKPNTYEEEDNNMDIEVGTPYGHLIAVGQTSTKTKTGWGLAFNHQHPGMFVTGNSDGSIACWDLNMIDNSQCMNKLGKFRNKKHSADPMYYMKDSKIRNKRFADAPPFITQKHPDEYHWFEEFEKYGTWNGNNTNPDIMSLDWCHDSSNIFVSSTANGQISIWDRRSQQVKKKPQLWTWGTSHNQSILTVSWNPIQHSLIASGDKANKVRIWDIRTLNRHIVQLSQHQSPVYHVKWCPYNKYLLGSSSADSQLFMYDLRRSGLKQEDASNTIHTRDHNHDSISKLLDDLSSNCVENYYDSSCQELVFAHYGHTACIPEFDWCPSGDLTMISTDMDGIIHTWQPPSGMLNTFAWVLHSHKQHYTVHVTDNDNHNSDNK
eukprot:62723_1